MLDICGWSGRRHSPEKIPGSFITSSTLRGSADYTEASTSAGWNRVGDKSQKAENSPFDYGSGEKDICQDLSIINTKSKWQRFILLSVCYDEGTKYGAL